MAKPKSQPEPRRPKPLIVPPRKEHTHTIILLHDKGDKGREFGRAFLKTMALQDHVPTVRFVFPCAFNAPVPPSTAAGDTQARPPKRVQTPTQWFDNPPHIRECANAMASLVETAQFLQRLVHEEAKVIAQTGRYGMHQAHRRIFIGGKGQGGAAALLYLLGSHRQLGGVICFDAVLPWEYQLEVALEVTVLGGGNGNIGAVRGLNLVRCLLGFEGRDGRSDLARNMDGLHHLRTPVFFGCGGESRGSGQATVSLLDCAFRMHVTERWCGKGGKQWYTQPDNVEAVLWFLSGACVPRVYNVTEGDVSRGSKEAGEKEV
ncbi:hypothetical protein BJX68DRAFT_248267 [Aspergillus pseudodeflectus]|uniref:Phospholipase/carboxylesterase/thioesterase domain-containing protein n=1 Tax=Aspergillus pseudodeflectus TaxID=176178 RepID=A0ABR4JHF4_9EURO